MFWTCVPMPFQMIPGTACAIWLRANVAIVCALTWLSNPLTWGLQVYGMYWVGRWIVPQAPAEVSGEWVWGHLGEVWKPFVVGFAVCTAVLTVGSYVAVRVLWRWQVGRMWRRRRVVGGVGVG